MQASQRVTDLSITVSFEHAAEAFDELRDEWGVGSGEWGVVSGEWGGVRDEGRKGEGRGARD
jgi:hypothetical protein